MQQCYAECGQKAVLENYAQIFKAGYGQRVSARITENQNCRTSMGAAAFSVFLFLVFQLSFSLFSGNDLADLA